MPTSLPPRFRTTDVVVDGDASMAVSAVAFRSKTLPRRYEPSWVIRCVHCMSFSRPDSESAENPPNTTVNGAPSRVSASIV